MAKTHPSRIIKPVLIPEQRENRIAGRHATGLRACPTPAAWLLGAVLVLTAALLGGQLRDRTVPAREGKELIHLRPADIPGTVTFVAAAETDPPDPVTDLGNWQDVIQAQGWINPETRHVVVLPGEGLDALAWALPGAYWAVHAGAPIVFAGSGSLASEAVEALRQFGMTAYVLGPAELISDRTVAEMARVVPVRRLSAKNPAELAIRVLRDRDASTGFGWGRKREAELSRSDVVVADSRLIGAALTALPLARYRDAALLLGNRPEDWRRALVPVSPPWNIWFGEPNYRRLWIVTGGDAMPEPAEAEPARNPWMLLVAVSMSLSGAGLFWLTPRA